jgi:hypothetical protein
MTKSTQSTPNQKIIHTQSGNLEGEALDYIEAVSPMPNEADLVEQIQFILDENVQNFFSKNKTKPEVVYYCCGPAPFLYDLKVQYPKFYARLINNSNITGIDLNEAFTSFNQANFPDFTWLTTDAITFKKTNQISILNSSYHHIPDSKKQDFLSNISTNLTNNGIVIMGENFLPRYKENESNREKSVNQYYSELIESYRQILSDLSPETSIALQKSITLMNQVRQEDINRYGEFKNHVWIFLDQLKESNLKLDEIIRVWPVKETLKLNDGQNWEQIIPVDFYGSSVFVLSKI